MNDKIVFCENMLWHFYFGANGICVSKLQQNPNTATVFDSGYFDFDVISDGDRTIHLICQDKEGSVIYFLYTDSVWHKKVIFLSKTKTAYTKSFKLISNKSLVCAAYTIVKDSRPMIVFQYLNASAPPLVIDYVTSAPRSFFVLPKSNFDIDIFYQNLDGFLGYKTYIWSKKDFSPFNSICENCSSPFAVSERKVAALSGSRIVFFENGIQTDIYNSYGSDLSAPSCQIINGEMFVIWQQGSLTFYSKQLQTGFSGASRFLSPLSMPLLFEIKTSAKDTSYIYAYQVQNKINLLSPSSALSVEDFFAKKEGYASLSEDDKLDEILKRIDAIYSLLDERKRF